MNEGTSVLLGLEDEFTVLQLERIDADTVRVVIEVIDPEGACPECGVLTSRIKERPLVRVKDLPASGQRTDLWWLKRRLVCREPDCGTATFTQQSRAVPARSRLTTRLREKIGSAIASATAPSTRSLASTRWRGRPRTGRSSHWPTSGCPSRNPPACSASTRPAPGRCAGCSKRPAGHGRTRG